MNLRHLRAFVSIIDAGGVARAAAGLHISQPALSRQIHALELELGVSLFDRIGRRVQLTAEGEDLLRQSRHVLAEVSSLAERAQALKSGHAGVLRVGATPQVIENLVADFLTKYERHHARVEVQLIEAGGARLGDLLARGDIHLAIMPAGDGRFRAKTLYPMCLVAVLPHGHSLCRSAALEIAELEQEPLLLLGKDFASHVWFDAACQVAHVRPRVLFESTAPQTIIALARTGYGIAVVPSPVRIPRKGVKTRPILHRGATIGRWTVVAWNVRRYVAPYAEHFVEELVAAVQCDYPGHDLIRRAPPLSRNDIDIGV